MPDLYQQAVADLVAEGLVQDLEAVQVEEEHGQVRARSLGAREGVGETVHEERPVGQAGQGVAEGLADQLVEPAGELVDLLRLLLDGREQAREGAHEGADLVLAAGLGGPLRVLLVADPRRARQRGRDVPHHEGAARHQDRGEDQERRDADQVGQPGERAQQLADRRAEGIGEEQQREDRAEGEGEDHLAPDLLAGERHLTIDRSLGHEGVPKVTDRARGMPRSGGPNRLITRVRARPRAYKLSRKATIFVYGAFHTALPSRSESSRLGASVGLVASEICGLPDSLPSPRLDPLGAATSHPRWPRVLTESWPLSR